ncbi:magnesium transporter [Panacagrimonas perspica]|uniref:Magnesium transporter n=1 Tax=Panacagrimonas perspica TaxID=381431 RepID=A0A4S3K705_9GAMM|nr:magnesium transporter [Panacagrimonas perspica]TDU26611.1 magnesium transporter [Panacagrimonas perspica]THD03972.1 magnesium transporter [Panacagrimonas perspica]
MSESSDQADLARLVRAVRGRVPLDAAQLLSRETPERVGEVLADLPQDLADRIQTHLPPELRRQAAEEMAEEVEGTVHEMMEPALALLPAATTVADAVAFLRAHATPQQITYLYVTGVDDRLIGMIVFRDLLLAEPEETLAEVMLPDPFAIPVDMEVTDAIKAALHRHYPVYPVVDSEQHVVGVIRGWRLFERQAMEISAQSGQMVGVDKEERLATTFWSAFRMRHPWLQVNLLTAFLAGFVVSMFEGTISQIVALAAFLPILAGQSGNTGCQALAITLRGITLGDIEKFPVAGLVRKEVMLGAMNGLFTGVVAGLAMWWTASRGGNADAMLLGLVIVLAMVGSCMMSGMFGVLVPITLRRFGADPATASSIFLTTGTDIAGMGLMLFLATTLVL